MSFDLRAPARTVVGATAKELGDKLGITTVEEVLSVTTAKEVARTTKNDPTNSDGEAQTPASLAVER